MSAGKKPKISKHPYISKIAWCYLYRFIRGSEKKLVFTSLGFVFQSMLIIPTLLLIRYLFDVAIPQKLIPVFVYIGLAILGIRALSLFLSTFLRKINIKIITQIIFNIRVSLLEKVFQLSRSYYTRKDMPLVHTRIIQDTERISGMIDVLASGLLPSLIIIAGLSGLLIYFNIRLFLIILIFIPVLILFNRFMGKKIKLRVMTFQKAFEVFSKSFLYVMNYMDLIKIQSTEKEEENRHIEVIDHLQNESRGMIYLFAVNGQIQTFLIGMIGIIVMVGGGISVAFDMMTLGELIAFYMASNQLQHQLNILSDVYTKIVTGNESFSKLSKIAHTNEIIPYSGTKAIDFSGQLTFESVSFQYTQNPVLAGISFRLDPGHHYAIIGSNGAGKSTIINLMLGFYKPQKGVIKAEGELFENIDLKSYRKQIGVVTQHPPLIPGSIRKNILYGNHLATENQLIEVSTLSLADDFIRRLPEKYDTQIGEGGVLLSGGERQKIAIARALLRKPGLLILDEPTNHLDAPAVKDIMNNLKLLDYNPTILIISHDTSVVKHAEQIYIIEEGFLKQSAINAAVE